MSTKFNPVDDGWENDGWEDDEDIDWNPVEDQDESEEEK